jgi:hypothetical protein
MPKNAYSLSYRKMSVLSGPPITLAVLGLRLGVGSPTDREKFERGKTTLDWDDDDEDPD